MTFLSFQSASPPLTLCPSFFHGKVYCPLGMALALPSTLFIDHKACLFLLASPSLVSPKTRDLAPPYMVPTSPRHHALSLEQLMRIIRLPADEVRVVFLAPQRFARWLEPPRGRVVFPPHHLSSHGVVPSFLALASMNIR